MVYFVKSLSTLFKVPCLLSTGLLHDLKKEQEMFKNHVVHHLNLQVA